MLDKEGIFVLQYETKCSSLIFWFYWVNRGDF